MRHNPIQNPLLILFQLLIVSSVTIRVSAQPYYSNFPSASGNYSSASPSGSLCLAPPFTDDQNVATANLTDYAQVAGLLSLALTCNTSGYLIRAQLNLPSGTTEVPAGYRAGFRVQFGSVASLALLQSNLSLRTYRGGTLRETVSGANLAGVSLLTGGSPADVYFTSTLSFDEVELDFNTAVLPVGAAFSYRFYYAFGALNTLPVKLTAFNASKKANDLTLTWTTVSEVGTDRFEVQRSSGIDLFLTIGVINAKSTTSSEARYTYSDRSVSGTGRYTYRLKIIDRDGSVEYSKIISTTGSDAASIKVYPSSVPKGQAFNVEPGSNSEMRAYLLDATGKVVGNFAIRGKTLVPTDHLNRGMYLLKITDDKNTVLVQRMIVQ